VKGAGNEMNRGHHPLIFFKFVFVLIFSSSAVFTVKSYIPFIIASFIAASGFWSAAPRSI
jgi:hypothetical protein